MKTKMTLLLMIFFCSLSTWANEKSSIKEEMNEKLLISSHEAPEPTVDLLTQPIQLAQLTAHKVEFINLPSDGKNKPQTQHIPHGGKVKRPSPDPTSKSLEFQGWKKVISGSKTESDFYDFNRTVTGPLKLYAEWKFKKYEVTFDSYFGNPRMARKTVTHGKKVTKPKDPIAPGKSFQHWFKENENIPYDFDNPVTFSLLLKAKWNILPVYTVTFKSHWKPLPPAQKVVKGDKAKEPTEQPIQGGRYEFDYWTLNGKKFDFNTPITEDIELTPKWTDNVHTVSFYADGGSPQPNNQRVKDGNKAKKPSTDPTKTGYEFQGWATVVGDNKYTLYDFTKPVKKQISLIARWSKLYFTITFDANEGTPTPTEQDVKKGKVATKPTDPKKEGFVFKGWMLTDGTSFKFETPITKDITLKAKWEKEAVTPPTTETHTITFDADEGYPTPSAQKVADGAGVTSPKAPKKEGYKFTGWAKGGVYYDFYTPVTSSFTLTATWELVTANIDISTDKEVHYYPNPVKNNLYLTCEEGIKEIHLFNVNGQCLRHLTPNEQTNVTVEMGALNAGFYLIKVTTPKGITTLKVIKQ